MLAFWRYLLVHGRNCFCLHSAPVHPASLSLVLHSQTYCWNVTEAKIHLSDLSYCDNMCDYDMIEDVTIPEYIIYVCFITMPSEAGTFEPCEGY